MKIRPKAIRDVAALKGTEQVTAEVVSRPPLDAMGKPAMATAAVVYTPLPSIDVGGPQLPAWVPATFDLKAAAAGMKSLLEQRGVPTAKVHELVITDADDTLVQTQAKTLLRDRVTGELAKDPMTGELLKIGAEIEAERADLQARFPELPWANLVNDFREFDDAVGLAASALIDVTVDKLRADAGKPDARRFVITARNAAPVLETLGAISKQHGLGIDSVLSASAATEREALHLGDAKPSTAQSKALMMAALVELYRPKHAELDHVTFYDDGDGNLAAAKELLPVLFPKTRFDFIDVVKQADGSFAHLAR